MANTGYKIVPTVRQYFTSGPDSGSVVSASFDVDLTTPPFSASVDGETFFYRSYDPVTCEPGFEDCLVPLLTSVSTGSRRGRFAINYVTQSGFNAPIDITASVSNDINFGTSEVFSASIDSLVPVTTSFTSGTIYFKAFTSCSGPDPSPDSSPLSFTYDLLPPPLDTGSVNITFTNTLSSPMSVEIRSTRGNANYTVAARSSITYDYGTSPDQGAWSATGKSDDLTITIKGGSKNTYGNYVVRRTTGVNKETYTTGGGFTTPDETTENSNTFAPDKGITFTVRQLVLPVGGTVTTTTFTLVQVPPPPPPPTPPPPPPPPGPAPRPPAAPTPTIQWGSSPLDNQDAICADSGVNYREKIYYKFGNVLYNSNEDALTGTKATFPYERNYILTSDTAYLIVNKTGYIQNSGRCILPTLQINYVSPRGYDTQEEACKRTKTSSGNQSSPIKDNRINSGLLRTRSGRYPLYEPSVYGDSYRGGRNIILSAGRIVGYETCGTELSTVQYGSTGFSNLTYPLLTPENINPRTLNRICSNPLKDYSLGPSGVVYYHIDSEYPYVPLGLGTRWYKTPDGTFANFDEGLIIDTASPC